MAQLSLMACSLMTVTTQDGEPVCGEPDMRTWLHLVSVLQTTKEQQAVTCSAL